jgi:hypothetical protein
MSVLGSLYSLPAEFFSAAQLTDGSFIVEKQGNPPEDERYARHPEIGVWRDCAMSLLRALHLSELSGARQKL